MNDKKQIKLMQRGDEKALESIILTYTNYVGTIIANQLGSFCDCQTVEELASDVFFSLWQNRNTLTKNNIKSWLGSTARNKAKNYIRSRRIVFEELYEDTIICSDDNAFDKLEADEQNEVISSALKKLDKKDQDILIRYYYYNQSTKQISIETKSNLETIKSRLNRSRKKLKDIFEEGGYFK